VAFSQFPPDELLDPGVEDADKALDIGAVLVDDSVAKFEDVHNSAL
jgi:hypothetical protein